MSMFDLEPQEICLFCRHWEPHGQRSPSWDHVEAECRKHAPTVSMVVTLSRYETPPAVWPKTKGRDWCSDWQLVHISKMRKPD